jgi:hypothetical protein
VFNPFLFVRRLYRFSVGLVALYLLHFCLEWLGGRWRALRETIAAERGLWRGDERWVRKRELMASMASAPNYDSWRAAAAQLDALEGERLLWKAYKPSRFYHWKRIARNVDSIRRLIATHHAQQSVGKSGGGGGGASGSLDPLAQAHQPGDNARVAAGDGQELSPSQQSLQRNKDARLSVLPACSSYDPHALMRYLRSRLMRNIGNITNPALYFNDASSSGVSGGNGGSAFVSTLPATAAEAALSFTPTPTAPMALRVGTKALIEEYHAQVMRGLETILTDTHIPAHTKLAFFRETRHAYGRSALILNGGVRRAAYTHTRYSSRSVQRVHVFNVFAH